MFLRKALEVGAYCGRLSHPQFVPVFQNVGGSRGDPILLRGPRKERTVPNIVVVGAGPVGLASALHLQSLGYQVHVIAQSLPGEGITGDLAAGIGCIFKPSSELIRRFVIESYPHSMRLAADSHFSAVAETQLLVVKTGTESDYSSVVYDYEEVSETHARYRTFAFDPAAWGAQRLDQLIRGGCRVEKRPISAAEVDAVLSGVGIAGYDYTIVAAGLAARDLRPDFGLYPVRGVLVHFPESSDKRSYMDEGSARYVISRPNGVVAGGTFDEHVGTCSESEELQLGAEIVSACNSAFGTSLRFDERVRVTAGFRPAVTKDAIMEFGARVAWLDGFGGQGWVPWAAVTRQVGEQVAALL
ncbi:MAG: FAD-binding oxidoreductase [Bdellovibrionales bacterium]|nr:FAD-binding oxidoreductase [Bdellovibrionales bacterium]